VAPQTNTTVLRNLFLIIAEYFGLNANQHQNFAEKYTNRNITMMLPFKRTFWNLSSLET